jgi:hypothetical protein
MPINKPFFPNLPEVKKVITPTGEVLIRKECKCGNEFMGPATQMRCEKCRAKRLGSLQPIGTPSPVSLLTNGSVINA